MAATMHGGFKCVGGVGAHYALHREVKYGEDRAPPNWPTHRCNERRLCYGSPLSNQPSQHSAGSFSNAVEF